MGADLKYLLGWHGRKAQERAAGVKGKAKWLVYINHFIIGWDDNIWWFALSLFLMEITPQSLQFTATYGLAGGLSVLLFGAAVGDWVDKTARLTVARVCVLVQNTTLICCSLVVFVVIQYKQAVIDAAPNEAIMRLCYALIVAMAIISNLTNMGRKTAIERDWIVEICNKDKDMLAELSATMRRISLLTMVVTPIVTGQILSLTSHAVGALVVAGWNFFTIFVEYYLLREIYKEVPQLRNKKTSDTTHRDTPIAHMPGVDVTVEFTEFDKNETNNTKTNTDEYKTSFEKHNTDKTSAHKSKDSGGGCSKVVRLLLSSLIALYRGWHIYRKYDVAYAGFGLASLYLTVLGFHGVTVGYCYSQGLSEGLIGGLLAVAACSGILGTFIYPYIRRRIGLQRTGLYALFIQISWLSLCVVSQWSPGSSFDPLFYSRLSDESGAVPTWMATTVMPHVHVASNTSTSDGTGMLDTMANTTSTMTDAVTSTRSLVSISLLMTGIIGSRMGLWMADLTINQLFLETVDVTERGIVGGVQNAINQLLELAKFVLVILLPVPEVFGYLVIISFCFICIGWTMFAIYVKKARGYVFFKT